MRRTAAVLCLVAVAAAGCGGDDDSEGLSATTTRPTTTASGDAPASSAPPPLADVNVTLTEVAAADTPMALVARTGTDTLYVAEREGRVRPLTGGSLGEPIVDISDEVVTSVEQGLLDIEFSADGATLSLLKIRRCSTWWQLGHSNV